MSSPITPPINPVTMMRHNTAVADYFLKLEGIPGETKDRMHREEIEVQGWSWGATQNVLSHTVMGKQVREAQANVRDMRVSMYTCRATPRLVGACLTLEKIHTAVLSCRKSGAIAQDYLIITLKDVIITSVELAGGSPNLLPIDVITLNFGQLDILYREQSSEGDMKGPLRFIYDVRTGELV